MGTRLQRVVSGLHGPVEAEWRVPLVVTADPREGVLEGRDHVEQRPRDDDVVVGAQPEGYHDCREPGTLKVTKMPREFFIFLN